MDEAFVEHSGDLSQAAAEFRPSFHRNMIKKRAEIKRQGNNLGDFVFR